MPSRRPRSPLTAARWLLGGWSVLAWGLAGCQGTVSPATGVGGSGSGPGITPVGTPNTPTRPAIVCDASLNPPALAWNRLSQTQVASTVRALVGDAADGLDRLLSAVPLDITDYPSVASPLSVEHLQAYGNIAAAVGDLMVLEPTVRDRYVECDFATMDDACARGFIRAFSEATERTPPSDAVVEERLALLRTEAQAEDGVRLVVRVVLQSSRFLYLVELGDPSADDGERWRLTSHEVATRLAYGLMGGPPDATLRAQAGSVALDDPAMRRAAVESWITDPRVRRHFREFMRVWLGMDDAPPPTFSDAFLDGLDLSSTGGTASFDEVAVDEVLALAERIAFDDDGTLLDLLTTRLGLPNDPRLAAVYGVPVGSDWVELPAERAGILTRVGVLYSGQDNEHPVLRGVHLRRRILCDNLPPPPPDTASMTPDELPERGDLSTRDWYDLLTQAPSCMGCHQAINPLGHALGAFDGIGRYRSVDDVYEAGALIGSHPVNTEVVPRISSPSETGIDGGAELSGAIAADPRSSECFASQLFHFTMGRAPEAGDGCTVAAMAEALNQGSMLDAWVALAAHEDFARRTIVGDER